MPVCYSPLEAGAPNESPWSSGESLHSGPPGDTGGFLGARSRLDGTGGTPVLTARRGPSCEDGAAAGNDRIQNSDEAVKVNIEADVGLPSLDLNLNLGGRSRYPRDVYVSRGRRLPTDADRQARFDSPSRLAGKLDAPSSMCVCEMCTCGGHACPLCTPQHQAKVRRSSDPAIKRPAMQDIAKSGARVRFEGVSSTRSDYSAPPAEALRAAFASASASPQAQADAESSMRRYAHKFEGNSTTKSDFQAPPLEELRNVLRQAREAPTRGPPFGSAARFEGQSCTHRDFPPPPADAFKAAHMPRVVDQLKTLDHISKELAKLDGQSSTHRGAPHQPVEVLETTFSVPAADESNHATFQVGAGSHQKHLPTPEHHRDREVFTFQGESTTHRDFPAHPLDAFKAAHRYERQEYIPQEWSAFEGESSMRRDFTPPPPGFYQKSLPRSEHHDDRESFRFQGESTTHRDFPAHPLDAFKAAHQFERQEYIPQESRAFEGESSMRRDFTPPPPGSHQKLTRPDRYADREVVKFEGESTSHRDFPAPPLDVFRAADQCERREHVVPDERPMFEGESATRRDFRPPPQGSYQQSLPRPERYEDRDVFKFQGESTSHRDFSAPPLDALRAAHQYERQEQIVPEQQPAFEGESATQRDFRPPPPGSYQQNFPRPERYEDREVIKFQGESTSRRDFSAPPLDALRAAHQYERQEYEVKGQQPAFEGESATQRDFRPPPPGSYQQSLPRPERYEDREVFKFQGESTSRRDFSAPPLDALRAAHQYERQKYEAKEPQLFFEGESAMRRDFPPPPPDSYRQNLPRPERYEDREVFKFQGESTSHRDFSAPPLDALRAAHQYERQEYQAKQPQPFFEGESAMRRDFPPPPPGSYQQNIPRPERYEDMEVLKFKGESTSHRDFQAPPLDSFRAANQYERSEYVLPHERPVFDGESSMQRDFRPPPAGSYQGHLPTQERYADRDILKFEGESTSHSDFPAPPLDAVKAAHQYERQEYAVPHERPLFEGESAMRRAFTAPPPGSYQNNFPKARHYDDKDVVKFEGESTSHRDFSAPPLDFLKRLHQIDAHLAEKENVPQERTVFDGESSMRRDFIAPPAESYNQALPPPLPSLGSDRVAFEGKSSTHSDFRPPSLDVLRETFKVPRPLPRSMESDTKKVAKFEGESSTHRDFQAPPLDALKAATQDGFNRSERRDAGLEIAKFEGESTSHRDFPAPPLDVLREAHQHDKLPEEREMLLAKRSVFEGESSTHRDFRAPSSEALRATFNLAQSFPSGRHHTDKEVTKFEGESTSHRDFPAPPRDVLRVAHQSDSMPSQRKQVLEDRQHSDGGSRKFEGVSSTHRDFPAPPLEAFRAAHDYRRYSFTPERRREKSRERTAFEGLSSTHRDFQAPPLEALRAGFGLSPWAERNRHHGDKDLRKFEGESSTHLAFRPPPQEALREAHSWGRRPSVHRSLTAPPAAAALRAALQRPSGWPSSPVEHVAEERTKFQGESSTHADFPPPPREAFLAAFPSSPLASGRPASAPRARARGTFEGESSMRRDFPPPSAEALKEAFKVPDIGSRLASAREERPLPPTSAADSPAAGRGREARARRSASSDRYDMHRFEGESSSHRDFQAPRLRAVRTEPLPAAGQGRRARSMPTRTSAQDSASAAHPSPLARRFEGMSSSQSTYKAPPREAYGYEAQRRRSTQMNFSHHGSESRDFVTTSQSAFQPPPTPSPCPAGPLCAALPPPAPPTGRAHVYFDATARQWH